MNAPTANTRAYSEARGPVPLEPYRAYKPLPFTRDERGKVTVLFGGLHWRAERLIQGALENLGYNTRINDGSPTCVEAAVCPRTYNGEFFAVWSGFFSPDFDIIGQLLY